MFQEHDDMVSPLNFLVLLSNLEILLGFWLAEVLFMTFPQKHKKKRKPTAVNFSALHLIHDPQGKV